MNATVAGALIGLLAALVGIVGTVLVARMGAQNSRQINEDTITAAHAEAARARADADEALRASREDARLALDTTREAQFADRYSRAIEQLGSSSPNIRSGGIYALEGIARDSPEWYHPVIMEVLTAFIREHPRTPPEVSSAQRRPPGRPPGRSLRGRPPRGRARHPDRGPKWRRPRRRGPQESQTRQSGPRRSRPYRRPPHSCGPRRRGPYRRAP